MHLQSGGLNTGDFYSFFFYIKAYFEHMCPESVPIGNKLLLFMVEVAKFGGEFRFLQNPWELWSFLDKKFPGY